MICNICGFDEFADVNGRVNAKCKNCGSLERARLFWLYVEKYDIDENTKILHIAPEKGIYNRIKSKIGSNYTVVDYSPDNFKFAPDCRHIDLTDLDLWPSDHYDYIFHMHVMEHVPCNISYTLFHLHRMLKKSGVHLCIIPFMGGKFDETFQDVGGDERTRRFGQSDHVRRFGRDDIAMHLGKIISLPKRFDATLEFSEQTLKDANIPETHWRGWHIGTVLNLKRDDYKLSF